MSFAWTGNIHIGSDFPANGFKGYNDSAGLIFASYDDSKRMARQNVN
jgi:hypothetical protein